MDRNVMGKAEYLLYHIAGIGAVSLWYKFYLFKTIPHHTWKQSFVIFILLQCLVSGIGIWYTFQADRNFGNLLINLILGPGIFFCVSYFSFFGRRIRLSVGAALLLSVFTGIILFSRRIRRKRRRRAVMRRRLYNWILKLRRNLAFALAAVMLPVSVNAVFTGAVVNSEIPVTMTYGEEYRIENNMETVLNIQEERWSELSMQERLNVLQVICNIEGCYLGLNTELYLSGAYMEGNVLSYYRDNAHTIVVSIDHLENDPANEVLESTLHECYHAYQHRLVDSYQHVDADSKNLLMFRTIGEYAHEFSHYIDGSDNPMGYYTQSVESSARTYAEYEAQAYYDRIAEYLNEDSKGGMRPEP